MEHKFTPGPWTVSTGCDQFVCSDSVWIASTMGVKGETGAANARLIAAAPELLAELIALRKRFHSACRGAGSDEEFVIASTPGADAAIAKATGEATPSGNGGEG